MSWKKRIGIGCGVLLAAPIGAALLGLLVNPILESRDRDTWGREGEILQLETGQVHVTVNGTSEQGPTVVFVPGLSRPASDFRRIREALPSDVRTLGYDRPGIVYTPATDAPRDLPTMVELREAISLAHVPPPYLFVGHSNGCPIVRRLAYEDLARTYALVLLDCASEASVDAIPVDEREKGFQQFATILQVSYLASRLGLTRVFNRTFLDAFEVDRHADVQTDTENKRYHAALAGSSTLYASWKEWDAVLGWLPPLREANDFGDVPVAVVRATLNHDGPRNSSDEEIDNLKFPLTMTSQPHYLEVESTHNVPLGNPEPVAELLRNLLDR